MAKILSNIEFGEVCSHPDDKNMVVFKNGNVYKFRSGWQSESDRTLIKQGKYKSKTPIKELFKDKDNDFYLGKAGVLLMDDRTLQWDY